MTLRTVHNIHLYFSLSEASEQAELQKYLSEGHKIAKVLNWDLNVQKEETQPVLISSKAYR